MAMRKIKKGKGKLFRDGYFVCDVDSFEIEIEYEFQPPVLEDICFSLTVTRLYLSLFKPNK